MHSTAAVASARHFVVAFVVAAVAFLSLDALWLTTMASRLYRPSIGHIMRPDFDALAAAAFYVLYLTGVVFFVVRPAEHARAAIARGAFFGLVCYGTYDLTNQATVAGWPWHLTMADLAWGAFATSVSAWIAYRLARAQRG